MENQSKSNIWFTVIVAALGYFVDIFDLQLFNIIGKQSLGAAGLNLSPEQITYYYDYVLFNYQMGGMLVGGLVWGIMGDKFGRKSILFGSILLYSLANFANGFVQDIPTYCVLRFLAGFGLAGELGAAVTLVSELMSKETRGIGTLIIVSTGALGAVAAAYVNKSGVSWQTAYFIGGGLGLMLLLLRFRTFESGMFDNLKNTEGVSKGNFFALFTDKQRFKKYLMCILVGLPIWFVLGIMIKFSPKFAASTGVIGVISVADAVMCAYIGLSVSDVFAGWLSQVWRSRKKVVLLYLAISVIVVAMVLFIPHLTSASFYVLCFLLGVGSGYWGLFVTIASEQFGTNLRATVTTTVPNFVRGSVILVTLAYKILESSSGTMQSTLIVGGISLALGFVAILNLDETFGKDLNYYEKE
ncbi:MAG: MFS transporter [Saprospiraceae bacterium]|nr:MFS transporter [Saprospiraceae bacterium]